MVINLMQFMTLIFCS